MRIAALGDLYCRRDQTDTWISRLQAVSQEADVLLLAGDLTDSGDLPEIDALIAALSSLTIPTVTTLGERDYDGGYARVMIERMRRAGIQNLEGAAIEIGGTVFVGGMGVEGGFDTRPRRRLSLAERQFTTRLRHYLDVPVGTPRVVLLHYVPVLAMLVESEPEELELLGSSVMETAIDAVGADLVLHAHALKGMAQGITTTGIPVFNVALPMLQRDDPNQVFRIFEVPAPR